MPSGKRSKQQRRTAAVRTPPPVRTKGGPRGVRQASPRALAIAGGVVVVAVVAIVLGIVFAGGGSGNSSGVPSGAPTIGSATGADALPGASDIQSLYQGIPQNGLYLGSPSAPVQMVMFVDLQCPVCKDFEVTNMPTLVPKYIRTGKVRLYLRPWAFIGPDSFKARLALIAASFQNKAFQFAGVLYDNQPPENTGWVTDGMLASIAASVQGLNVKQVFAQRDSSQVKAIASQVDAQATADKVVGTPTVFVGKTGTQPQDVSAAGSAPTLQEVETAIDAALAK